MTGAQNPPALYTTALLRKGLGVKVSIDDTEFHAWLPYKNPSEEWSLDPRVRSYLFLKGKGGNMKILKLSEACTEIQCIQAMNTDKSVVVQSLVP